MEVLNYSLWFTLIWFCFILWVFIDATHNTVFTRAFTYMFIPPAIAILLEYLIMRG